MLVYVHTHSRTYIGDDNSELGVEGVVHLPYSTFVAPEGVVVLAVSGVGVPCRGEELVPGCGICICLWDTVTWLPAHMGKHTLRYTVNKCGSTIINSCHC